MFITAMACLVAFIPFFFTSCNFGENVTTAFSDNNESIYKISWYKCSVTEQKYLIPMIMMAEKPFHLAIFAEVDCTRDTFKRVTMEPMHLAKLAMISMRNSMNFFSFLLCIGHQNGIFVFHDATALWLSYYVILWIDIRR